jgi:hypothetical protein
LSGQAERFRNRDRVLKFVEEDVDNLYNHNVFRVFSYHELVMLADLESKREKLLQEREFKWCMKSRVVWLDLGNENTKLFHLLC